MTIRKGDIYGLIGRNGAGKTTLMRLIAGLIPEPLGEMSAEDRKAIDERTELVDARALTLATAAVDAGAPWTRRLGRPPTDPKERMAGNRTSWKAIFSLRQRLRCPRDRARLAWAAICA